MPLLLLGSDDIECAHTYERPLQSEGKRLGRRYSDPQAVKRAWTRSNRYAIDILHSIATFSQQTLNVFQQLYAVVVAYLPCILAVQDILAAERNACLACRS